MQSGWKRITYSNKIAPAELQVPAKDEAAATHSGHGQEVVAAFSLRRCQTLLPTRLLFFVNFLYSVECFQRSPTRRIDIETFLTTPGFQDWTTLDSIWVSQDSDPESGDPVHLVTDAPSQPAFAPAQICVFVFLILLFSGMNMALG